MLTERIRKAIAFCREAIAFSGVVNRDRILSSSDRTLYFETGKAIKSPNPNAVSPKILPASQNRQNAIANCGK
ncbi:hypothetical protein [Tolypothrix sp. PCC 7601]|uniref:hypothetical protein n=1 Tax=Tolypothrix sp. PCC 7601 TaxID=1188 RepID=UPI001AF00067|nr:hypothetical protein [Tolypothrix sp. PCC 7601]